MKVALLSLISALLCLLLGCSAFCAAAPFSITYSTGPNQVNLAASSALLLYDSKVSLSWQGVNYSHPSISISGGCFGYMLLICREKNGGVEVLSSQFVSGEIKRTYLRQTSHIVQLFDEAGLEAEKAYYEVVRAVRWDEPVNEAGDLTGGSIPAPEVVFTVRVPYSSKAKWLRLSETRKVSSDKRLFTAALSGETEQTVELLTVPISELPGQPEVCN